MINLTVKTLDSHNHAFSVDDEISIAQFKEQIADTVNIPPETQRLIYCGRVLQDTAKVKDYDVDGKVIHLVQRPPPSSVLPPDTAERQPQPRRLRGLEYVGTVRLPVSGIENTLHSLPIQSLANSRLNVAKRMISRAETVMNQLENPARQEQPMQSEPQEEATPVFEARVMIPNATVFQAADEASASSDIPVDPILPPQEIVIPDDIESVVDPLSNGVDPPHSVSSTPEVISPLSQSTENLTSVGVEASSVAEESTPSAAEEETTPRGTTSTGTTTGPNPPSGNASRTAEFADILDSLHRLHTRFTPFMEQYNTFMRNDPVIPQGNIRCTQAMINRVSEVCHYMGHAYHSVSDIILRVRTQPPRALLCRPMLIQHSAVVQVDIPIQVEAQINIPNDRNTSATTTTTNTSTTSSTTQPTGASPVTSSTTNSNSTSDSPLSTLLAGIPFIPRSGGVRVETYRLPIFEGNNLLRNNNNSPSATFRSGSNPLASEAYVAAIRSLESRARSLSTTASTTTTSTTNSNELAATQPMDVASAIASSVVNSLSGNATSSTGGGGGATINMSSSPGESNNPNVEFFMEVTPESITIDSLETAFVGANQSNDLNAILQESMNQPPPEFIQSIMQMAGQLINRSNIGNNATASTTSTTNGATSTVTTAVLTPSAPPLEVSSSSTSDTTAATTVGAARTTPFQNSQARGNTQTQPTTATHTRSTPRPHVHLAQHTMHAFDPFLPCNSHHILTRRRVHNANNGTVQQHIATRNINSEAPVDPNDDISPVYSIMRNLLNSVRSTYSNSLPPAYARRPNSTGTGPGSNVTPTQDLMNAAATWISTVPDESQLDYRPTIARILHQFPDNSYTIGASIFIDLVMLLARVFTVGDIMQIISGRLEPLTRISAELRTFVVHRILIGNLTDAGYDTGVEKLLSEMQLFLDHLALLETRDNIDVTRSVQALLRARLPNIISLAVSQNPSSTRLMFEQIRTTAQQLGALILHASVNGSEGVQTIFESFMIRLMDGIPTDLQQWSLQTSRPQLTSFINNLDVPESLLQRYIIRSIDSSVNDVPVENHTEPPEPEPMQVDEIVERNSDEVVPPALQLSEDNETLQTVVLGSAPWHAQVPSDWVPIIVRDSQRQRRQNSQAPFSDAYLSGMPSKRRKLADCSKPPGSISQVISESVRRAVTTTGLTAVAPIETVTQAAAADVNIRSAYRELLHSSVQSELENNEDFSPEQFPNVDSYFNNRPQ